MHYARMRLLTADDVETEVYEVRALAANGSIAHRLYVASWIVLKQESVCFLLLYALIYRRVYSLKVVLCTEDTDEEHEWLRSATFAAMKTLKPTIERFDVFYTALMREDIFAFVSATLGGLPTRDWAFEVNEYIEVMTSL